MNHDQPKLDENIEKPKLEWGHELMASKMTWSEVQDAIMRLNESQKSLGEDKRPWRLPTGDELTEALCDQFENNKQIGFSREGYWASDTIIYHYTKGIYSSGVGNNALAFVHHEDDDYDHLTEKGLARCVR